MENEEKQNNKKFTRKQAFVTGLLGVGLVALILAICALAKKPSGSAGPRQNLSLKEEFYNAAVAGGNSSKKYYSMDTLEDFTAHTYNKDVTKSYEFYDVENESGDLENVIKSLTNVFEFDQQIKLDVNNGVIELSVVDTIKRDSEYYNLKSDHKTFEDWSYHEDRYQAVSYRVVDGKYYQFYKETYKRTGYLPGEDEEVQMYEFASKEDYNNYMKNFITNKMVSIFSRGYKTMVSYSNSYAPQYTKKNGVLNQHLDQSYVDVDRIGGEYINCYTNTDYNLKDNLLIGGYVESNSINYSDQIAYQILKGEYSYNCAGADSIVSGTVASAIEPKEMTNFYVYPIGLYYE